MLEASITTSTRSMRGAPSSSVSASSARMASLLRRSCWAVSPRPLREELRQTLAKMLALYEGDPAESL